MKTQLYFLILLFLVFACKKEAPNLPPKADAGADISVNVGAKVTLNGNNSSDPEKRVLVYSWAFVSRPNDSQSSLQTPSAVTCDFIPDRPGTYIVSLTVTDDAQQTSRAQVTVTVSIPGKSPVADAGKNATITFGQTANLDGSNTKDPDNDKLTYKWEIKTRPSGSTVVLPNADQAKTSFIPDAIGKYVCTLTVSDGNWPAVQAEVEITVEDAPAQELKTGVIGASGQQTLWKNIVQDPNKPDYIVFTDLSIRSFLTIEPGVVIFFRQNTGMVITNGAGIKAKGTANQRITFTGEQKVKGFWKSIAIESNDPRNEFDYVEVSYAGSESGSRFAAPANLIVLGRRFIGQSVGLLKITNSTISFGKARGIYVDADGIIEGFANNIISDNNSFSISVPAMQVEELDAQSKYSERNGTNYIEIWGGNLSKPAPNESLWKRPSDGTKYLLTGQIGIATGLKIASGNVFEADDKDAGLYVDNVGYIVAKGTKDARIVFTGKTKIPGIWKGLAFFNKDVRNELDFVEVSYGGSQPFGRYSGEAGNISLWDWPTAGGVKITNSIISNSAGWGIQWDSRPGSSRLTLDNPDLNTYSNNKLGNIAK